MACHSGKALLIVQVHCFVINVAIILSAFRLQRWVLTMMVVLQLKLTQYCLQNIVLIFLHRYEVS